MAFTSAAKSDVDRSASVVRLLLAAIIFLVWTSASADPVETKIGYLRRAEPKTGLSLIQMPPENNGIAGAQLAINDNNTTGKFLNQQFSLEEIRIDGNKDAAAATATLAERGASLVIADLPADDLLAAADSGESADLLLFNVSAIDDRLREDDYLANLIYT